MKILIENSTNKGDLVIDPFMGVGATGVASKELERDFIGIELDEKYYNIAHKRIVENVEREELTKKKKRKEKKDLLYLF